MRPADQRLAETERTHDLGGARDEGDDPFGGHERSEEGITTARLAVAGLLQLRGGSASTDEESMMDAIRMLEHQHRQMDELFEQLDEQADDDARERLFLALADLLAVHTTIEERHFYPSVREGQTEELVQTAIDEHRGIKRMLAELLEMDVGADVFEDGLRELMDAMQHHIESEESDLFPSVRRMLDADALAALGEEMSDTMEELEEMGAPRSHVLGPAPAEAP
jgi:hemerythrin superfamily protein